MSIKPKKLDGHEYEEFTSQPFYGYISQTLFFAGLTTIY
jgi:hypothetical protein